MNEFIEFYLEFMSVWYVALAVIGGIGLMISGMGSLIEEEPKYIARALLMVLVFAASGLVWPISIPLLVLAGVKWSWKYAELDYEKPLPRKERRRIQHELDLARADKILDESLAELELKRHIGTEYR